ncbi:hypothetical protein EBU60_05615 [bacterium]|nr:hypothetical protein [bacterium]
MNLVLLDLRVRGESLIVWPAQREEPRFAAVLEHIQECQDCGYALTTSIYDGIGTRQEARVSCDAGADLLQPLLQERKDAEHASTGKRAAWIAEQRNKLMRRSRK